MPIQNKNKIFGIYNEETDCIISFRIPNIEVEVLALFTNKKSAIKVLSDITEEEDNNSYSLKRVYVKINSFPGENDANKQ